MCPARGWDMFEALLEKRAYHRAYQKRVYDCLSLLFSGFPAGLLPVLRQRVGSSRIARRSMTEGTDAHTCAVHLTVLIIRKLIGALREAERQDLAVAFLQNDTRNPTYKGFERMFRVLYRLDVSPALVSYLKTEVAGQLRGMSQQDILGSWVELQIGRVMVQIRERCLEEADFKADLGQ
jgi:hypothetical protein